MNTYLREHKAKITAIVNEAICETFRVYFKLEVNVEKIRAFETLDDGVTCKTEVFDKDAKGAIFLSIERKMLLDMANAVYPPEIAESREALESCAMEITNIVCARLKSYFNEHGYNFEMGIPEIVNNHDGLLNDIEIVFSVKEKKMIVDIGMQKSGSDPFKQAS